MAQYHLQQYTEAIASFQECLDYSQDMSEAMRGVIRCYFKLSMPAEALQMIERYAASAKADAELVYYYKAELLRLQGYLSQATKLYIEGAKAIKDIILWQGAAECLLLEQQWEEAKYYLAGVIRYDEKDSHSLLHLTYAALVTGQWAEAGDALASYFSYVQPANIDPMSYFYQGVLCYYALDYAQALLALQRAATHLPLPDLHSHLSLVCFELGQTTQAIHWATLAMQAAPGRADYRLRLSGVQGKRPGGLLLWFRFNRKRPLSIQLWPADQPIPHHAFANRYFPALL